ncbi:MAG: hypothetical protein AAF378_17330 [Cyanobacteria bacterium P01_A01_bin.84]
MIKCKLLIATVLFSSTVLGISSAAKAETEDVFFNGSYTAGCQFNSKTDGTVTPNALFSANSLGSTSTYDDAISGEVKVICNSLLGGLVTAAEPEVMSAPTDASFDVKTSFLDDAPGATGKVITGNTETPIKVDMVANSTSTIPTGDYQFKVVVTATPN